MNNKEFKNLKPGDLVIFKRGSESYDNHFIYIREENLTPEDLHNIHVANGYDRVIAYAKWEGISDSEIEGHVAEIVSPERSFIYFPALKLYTYGINGYLTLLNPSQ